MNGNNWKRRELERGGDICQYSGSDYSHNPSFLGCPSLPLHSAYVLNTETWRMLETSFTPGEQAGYLRKQQTKNIWTICLPSLSRVASLDLGLSLLTQSSVDTVQCLQIYLNLGFIKKFTLFDLQRKPIEKIPCLVRLDGYQVFIWNGFPGGASGKEPTWQWRRQKRPVFCPWLGKAPWRKAQATHSRILTWRMTTERGIWWAMVHKVAKSWTQLKQLSMHTHSFWKLFSFFTKKN